MPILAIKPKEGILVNSKFEFHWGGTVTYLANGNDIMLFANESTQYHPKMNEVQKLVDFCPSVFSKVDFYTEDGSNKVMLHLNKEYNVEFK